MLYGFVRCFRKLQLTTSLVLQRTLLSEAYYCNKEWSNRLNFVGFNTLNANDLGAQILQRISTNGHISNTDYDIFANKLHEFDVTALGFAERVIKSYNTTPSALEVMDTACHAVVRSYLAFHEDQRLMKLLSNRAETGIFLDNISANFLMDTFAKQDDWASAVAVVWELCLQSYFESASSQQEVCPLTSVLALYSCLQFLVSTSMAVKEETTEAQDDSDDTIHYELVPYIRNPNYDAFFDVDRPRLKMGYSLLQLSDFLARTSQLDELTASSLKGSLPALLRLFAYVVTEQPQKAAAALKQFLSTEKLKLNRPVVERLITINKSSVTRSAESEPKPGEPVYPTESEVASFNTELEQLLSAVADEEDTITQLTCLLRTEFLDNPHIMEGEVERVRKLYRHFEEIRNSKWDQHLKQAKQQAVLKTAKQTLRKLMDEEERLSYFKDLPEVERSAWLAPRTRAESRWSRLKDWRRDLARYQAKRSDGMSKS